MYIIRKTTDDSDTLNDVIPMDLIQITGSNKSTPNNGDLKPAAVNNLKSPEQLITEIRTKHPLASVH
jgi:hypothetical protein